LNRPNTDKVFAGSIPKLYEEYLVPLIFEPYAADLANRVAPGRKVALQLQSMQWEATVLDR
jgi:hypothetical protein